MSSPARSFAEYSTRYERIAMTRSEKGVLELRLHTEGKSLLWGDTAHTELPYCFADVAADPDNRVVILTGCDGDFICRIDESWLGPMNPVKWEKIFHHGKRLLQNLLDIEVPVIAAVDGRATVHSELAIMSNIVLASTRAVFADAPHFPRGTVSGDGVHIAWPHVLGPTRGSYFLLTGERLCAVRALQLGVVNEVVEPEQLLPRAHEIAQRLALQADTTLRYTRQALTLHYKRLLLDGHAHGLALEGLGAYSTWPQG
jgi:enoyl-CoA hydratase/carnithine racemase